MAVGSKEERAIVFGRSIGKMVVIIALLLAFALATIWIEQDLLGSGIWLKAAPFSRFVALALIPVVVIRTFLIPKRAVVITPTGITVSKYSDREILWKDIADVAVKEIDGERKIAVIFRDEFVRNGSHGPGKTRAFITPKFMTGNLRTIFNTVHRARAEFGS